MPITFNISAAFTMDGHVLGWPAGSLPALHAQ